MNKVVIILALSLSTLWACTDSKSVSANNVLSVTDFDYTMNNQQAVSISFGATNTNFCSVTVYRNSIESGYSITSNQKSDADLSMDCHWDGNSYVQSSKHPTSANVKISDLNYENKTAKINISLNLVNPSNDEYFSLKDISLIVNNEQFDHLIKKI